jgi:hypothetical protein
MRSTTVLLSVISLFVLFCGCRKEDKNPVLLKGLRGKIIVSSCVTTAVQVLNKDIGSSWTDCRDQQTYQNMIEVVITNLQGRPDGKEFNFEIVEKEPYARCLAADYCGRGPSESYHIAIVQD